MLTCVAVPSAVFELQMTPLYLNIKQVSSLLGLLFANKKQKKTMFVLILGDIFFVI